MAGAKRKPRRTSPAQLLSDATEAMKCLDEMRGGGHTRDTGFDPNESHEFDIKWPRLDIPQSVRDRPGSEEIIAGIVDGITEFDLPVFMESIQEDHPWIGKWTQVGRSGGWLAISDKEWTYSNLDEAKKEFESDFDPSDEALMSKLKDAIRAADKRCEQVNAIATEVDNTIAGLVKEMRTVEFWDERWPD